MGKCKHEGNVELTEFGTCHASTHFEKGKIVPVWGSMERDITGIFRITCHDCGFTHIWDWYKNKHIPLWAKVYYEHMRDHIDDNRE